MAAYVAIGPAWARPVEADDHLGVLLVEPTADMALGPLAPDTQARVLEVFEIVAAGQAHTLDDVAVDSLVADDQVHDLRRLKPGGAGASRLVRLGGTFGGGVGLAEAKEAMIEAVRSGEGATLQGRTIDVNERAKLAAESAKLVAPNNGPRNRAERRAKAKMDRKFRAAPQRLHHENRYTQAHEFMDAEGARKWDDLDREDQKDVLEQADQSRDRW